MLRLCIVTCLSLLPALAGGCGDESQSGDLSDGGGSADGPVGDARSTLPDAADPASLGRVDFVPIYETGSAWESNDTARSMVDTLFADLEATLRSSGTWDASIEVYLSDDNTGNANTSFEQTFSDTMVAGQRVVVVPAWREIVEGSADANGPALADGTGAEFTIHFNVADHEANAGLLRHEMMHGLGAVTTIASFTMSSADELTGPAVGERKKVALYDLHLVDLDGQALLGNYQASTEDFEIQSYRVDPTLVSWMDGDGGMFFRGQADNGGNLDMACSTFPFNADLGGLVLNEPSNLMSASKHPTWNTLGEPDRAFFRAMGYQFVP